MSSQPSFFMYSFLGSNSCLVQINSSIAEQNTEHVQTSLAPFLVDINSINNYLPKS